MSTTTGSGFFILRESGDIIWFDAITNMSKSYNAGLSKHPLADGAMVTDHATYNNPKWTVAAVLSDADFNLSRPNITSDQIVNKQFTNNTVTATPVKITGKSTINKYLPEVIAQYTKDTIPTVVVTPQAKAKVAKAVEQTLQRMIQTHEKFKFVEYDGNSIVTTTTNCILTDLTFKEDENTGDGIFPSMTFEEVRFATLSSIKVQVKTSNKGRQNGSTKTKSGTDNVANAPSTYSKKSVLDYDVTPNSTNEPVKR